MKTRISKKFLAQFPVEIQNRIQSYPQIKSATYEVAAAGSKEARLFAGEGYKFHVFYQGQEKSLEMVSEMSVGASGVSHDVTGCYPLPAGATAIELYWLCDGKRAMRILNVSEVAIEG